MLHQLPTELFTRPVEDVQYAEVSVLPITIAPATDSTSTSFVGDSGIGLGRLGADAVADALVEQFGSEDVTGEVVTVVCVPGLSVLTSRIDGFADRMAVRLPDVLEPIDSKADPAQNLSMWQQSASANPDANAVMGPCQQDVQSLVKIKQDSGATWQFAGFDIDDIAIGGVEDGAVVGLFPSSSYVHGYVATRLLGESLKGGTPLSEGWIEMPVVPVTAENVDEIITREASLDAQAEYWNPHIDEILGSDPAYPPARRSEPVAGRVRKCIKHVRSPNLRIGSGAADVSFYPVSGEVHALRGMNGAGKSTLVKVLVSAEQPDAGTSCSTVIRWPSGRHIRQASKVSPWSLKTCTCSNTSLYSRTCSTFGSRAKQNSSTLRQYARGVDGHWLVWGSS